MSRQCPCGHDHGEHAKPYGDTRQGEIAWCNHRDEIITGYKPRITYSSNYAYGQFANSGPQPSIIHHNYGGNPAPYVANSYSNTVGATTYITKRDYGSITSHTSTNANGLEPIIDLQSCNCNRCKCEYCRTPECANEQATIRARNDHAWAQLGELIHQEKAREAIWREGTFAQRRQLKGTFRAILKTLRDIFVCQCCI